MQELTDRELDAVTGGGFRPLAVASLTTGSPGLLGRGARWFTPMGLAAPPRLAAASPEAPRSASAEADRRPALRAFGRPTFARLGTVFRFPS